MQRKIITQIKIFKSKYASKKAEDLKERNLKIEAIWKKKKKIALKYYMYLKCNNHY